MIRLTLTTFADLSGRLPQTQDVAWETLVSKIRTPRVYERKGSCPLLKLARFGNQRTEEGSLRHDANMVDVTGIEGDYDGEIMPLTEAAMLLADAGIEAALYTSPSHRSEAPRWRVLAPLSRPYPPAERARFVARLNGALGGVLTTESFAASQAFYVGRVNGAPYAVQQVRGQPIDLIEGLAEVYATGTAAPGERDETTDGELVETFHRGDGRRTAGMKLAARYIGRGMAADDALAALLALLDASKEPDPRHRAKLEAEIRHAVSTAASKFRDPRAADVPEAPDDLPPLAPIEFYDHDDAAEPSKDPDAEQDDPQRSDAPNSWPAPLDIFRQPAAPLLGPADFPAVLSDFAEPLARAAGHDPAAYLMAGLAAGAAAISDGLRIMLDSRTSWFESARLWVLLVGAPGAAKTPAIRATMTPLYDLHRELRAQYAAAIKGLGEDGDKPPRPALFVNDATIEALSEVLADNERGIIAVYEELDTWLGAHDCYRGGQGSKDRGEWLRLFDGGPHQVDRIKRGSFFIRNWGASILGATTPAGLRRHLRELPPDGLIQRFLPVMVRPMTAVDDTILGAQIRGAREEFERVLFALHGAPPGVRSSVPRGRRNILRPP